MNRFKILRPYVAFTCVILAITTASRLLLATWNADRIEDLSSATTLFLSGLRVDIAVICMAIFPALLLHCMSPRRLLELAINTLVHYWLLAWCLFILFMEAATPPYLDFFSMRPGRIFFEYLESPGEVTGLLTGGYLVESILAILIPVGGVYLVWRKRVLRVDSTSRLTDRLVLVLVIPLLVLGGRSTLGHRPLNPSMVAFSSDQLVNELVLNSAYSVSYAMYALRHEEFESDDYPDMEDADVISVVKESMPVASDHFVENDSIQRFLPASGEMKNIVVVVEESLGARFVGSLGGLPLTPSIDALSKESLWFSQLYATGIRSARGLEAIVAGFPPSSSRSVLKLSGTQPDFFTYARPLAEHGYRNYFFYGGESHFDNMRGFFLANGFHEAFDIRDMKDAEFTGVWGASDEDVFRFADRHIEKETEPFFALIFTSSFHSPFEFPDGRIELYEQPKQTKHNAVKYADYALGQFIEEAKRSPYWEDTVFLIVADHDERPRGRTLVPVESYHIPGMILGSDVPVRDEQRVTSQIDLLPTTLALAGVPAITPSPGMNILDLPADYPGRALMQYGYNHAYMEGTTVLIHQPDKPSQAFMYDRGDFSLTPVPLDEDLARKALAFARLPSLLYQQKRYGTRTVIEKAGQ